MNYIYIYNHVYIYIYSCIWYYIWDREKSVPHGTWNHGTAACSCHNTIATQLSLKRWKVHWHVSLPQQQPWHNPRIPGLLVTPNFLNFGQSTPDWNLTRNPHDWILQAHCTLNWTDIYQQTDVCQQTNISNSRLRNNDGECNLYTWFLTARNPWRAAQRLPAWGEFGC